MQAMAPGREHLSQGNTEAPTADPAVWAAGTSLGLQRLRDTFGGQRAELLYPGKDVACSSTAIKMGDR